MAGFSYICQISFIGSTEAEINMMKTLCSMAIEEYDEIYYYNSNLFTLGDKYGFACSSSFHAYFDEALSFAPMIIADLFPNSEFCYRIVQHYDNGGGFCGGKAEYINKKLLFYNCDEDSDNEPDDLDELMEESSQRLNAYKTVKDMDEEDLQILSYVECFYSLHEPIELSIKDRKKGHTPMRYTENFETKEDLLAQLAE